jgi:menaquinol-cytochrome c reductase iron-sulfur subunit
MSDARPGLDTPQQQGRRKLLSAAVAVLASFIGGAIAVPAIGHIISPALKSDTKPLLSLGAVDDFTVGEPRRVDYVYFRSDGWIEERTSGSAWVLRTDAAEFAVFDPRCTHLGCPYGWNPDSQQFICPCHNGIFAPDGSVISGPVPRPLDRFEHSVTGGNLFVREVVQRA